MNSKYNSILGPDAIRPFMTKEPQELYKDAEIDVDIMTSVTNMVSSNCLNFK